MSGPNDPNDASKKSGTYRELAPYLTLGFQLAAAVVVFFFIGKWLDDRYGTSPVYMIIGSCVGIAGGLFKFYKTVLDLEKKNADKN